MTDKKKIHKVLSSLWKNDTSVGTFDYNQALQDVQTKFDLLSEEPVNEELEEASKEWLSPQLDKSYAAYGETKQMELARFDGYAMLDAIEFGAQWQKEQMMKDAVNGLVYAQRTNGEVMFRSNYVKKEGFKFGDKVKVIVIKED
jgi:hypothetical protein